MRARRGKRLQERQHVGGRGARAGAASHCALVRARRNVNRRTGTGGDKVRRAEEGESYWIRK